MNQVAAPVAVGTILYEGIFLFSSLVYNVVSFDVFFRLTKKKVTNNVTNETMSPPPFRPYLCFELSQTVILLP